MKRKSFEPIGHVDDIISPGIVNITMDMRRFFRSYFQPYSLPLVAIAITGAWGIMPVFSMPLEASLKQTSPATEDAFTRAMRIGYAATAQFDYHTALINFRRALQLKPENPFAQAAVENVEYYIQRDRMARIQRQINTLETRLAAANEAKDWVCAAATVDELVTYTESNSLNRQRLLGYRGELSGLLDARADLENWSTVCTPDRPLQ